MFDTDLFSDSDKLNDADPRLVLCANVPNVSSKSKKIKVVYLNHCHIKKEPKTPE